MNKSLLTSVAIVATLGFLLNLSLNSIKKNPIGINNSTVQTSTIEYNDIILPAGKTTVTQSSKKTLDILELPEGNTIPLIGEIGGNAMYVAQKINSLSRGKSPIYLLINSPGGSVLDGAQIVTAIQSSKVPVYTVCLQLCASMAAIIHQYGTQRYMVDRSFLMFHEASGGFQGSFNQMKSRMVSIDRYITKMDAYIAQRAGYKTEEFTSRLGNEIWVDAEDATTQRFNDKVINVYLSDSLLNNQDTVGRLSQTHTISEKLTIQGK